jgi:hypothetical protein
VGGEKPLVTVALTPEDKILCKLWLPPDGWTHATYALVICDLVRHVARAFQVDEGAVWKWVDKERQHPTTDIEILHREATRIEGEH